MSLTLTITTPKGGTSALLDLHELGGLHEKAAADVEFSKALGILIGGEAGESVHKTAGEVAKAVDLLLARSSAFRIAVYSIFGSPMPGQLPPRSCSGMSGARVGDEMISLRGGSNQCSLKRYRLHDGQWHLLSTEDARQMKRIETDNMGTLEIRKRTKPTRFLAALRQAKELLTPLPPTTNVSLTLG